MFSILRSDEPVKETHHTLEQVLCEMTKYGKPRISYIGDGWFSTIEMNTNSKGVSFEVKSDFNHVSPVNAVIECRSRMMTAISQYKDVK